MQQAPRLPIAKMSSCKVCGKAGGEYITKTYVV